MRTICVIQARMGSTRLPGKVMMHLDDHPVLEWVVRACNAAPGIDEVIVATTLKPLDDSIANWCDANKVCCVRGSEDDVLSRFALAAQCGSADVIVRVTGDEPFVDPRVISEVLRARMAAPFTEYCSNVHPRTYPDGLDVECFTRQALMAANDEATRPIDRETVTYWIHRNRSRFPAECVTNPVSRMEKERWVLDTADDLKFCQAVAFQWGWDRGPPSQMNILQCLDRYPKIRAMNADHIMNERFYDALAQEEIYPRSYARSQAQLKSARKHIPLGAQTFSKSHLQFPQPSPLFVSHGEGGLVWDIDGNEYVDLVSALLPNVLGYCDPDVDRAVRRQLSAGCSFSLATELEAQLAAILVRLIPCAEKVRFGKTGTDVTTAAVRLARAYTGRERIAMIHGGYHGWADWSVDRNLGVPKSAQELVTKHNGLSEIVDAMSAGYDGYAAVIVEPEHGTIRLQELRERCTATDTVLIFDEVITGFRYSLGGAQHLFGVTPDLACFGKAMANGMPISALVGRAELMDRLEPPNNIFYSGTFFGETLSIAAAIATIDKLERESIIQKIWAMGTKLRWDIDVLAKRHGLDHHVYMHGQAPMIRLSFEGDDLAALFRKEMISSGTLIIASNNLCAAHGHNEIARVLKSYDHAFGVMKEAIVAGNVSARLEGGSIERGVRQ